jgi:basic amino acid/polyamine antiporter, APA family
VIGLGTVLAIALLLPADLDFLVGICAFGATIAFAIVTIGVIRLRWREPDRDRPYKMPLNVPLGRGELPLLAVLGALMSLAALGALLFYHGGSRWVGVAWMAFGVALYVYYRISEDKPVFRRVTVPEKTLTRPRQEAEYGSILVPIRGLPLDDDIVQTAGRLAAEENEDLGEGGAVIEALWVFEVPLSLPLDARVPEEELKRARRALARAKAVGEEYEGVEVATAVVRARRAGEAIVHEARRRGVEAIVLAAEEKAQIRGGTLLGGKAGLRDTFVGETTRHVVNKAPCRVILTAAPPQAPSEAPPDDLSAPPLGGDPARPGDEPVVAGRSGPSREP